MKWFLFGIIAIAIAVGIGFVGLKYIVPAGRSPATTTSGQHTAPVVKTGILQPLKGDDYNYAVSVDGKLIGVNSQTINLAQFVGKKVTISGQYSGTTLYADSVTIAR